jgi:hypothetical protein
MKCYISGKISGLPQEEAFNKFEKAEKDVEHLGYKPVNPMKLCPFNKDFEWEDYMEKDIGALLRCKAIYMLKDWGNSKGARCEYALAKELDLKIIFE